MTWAKYFGEIERRARLIDAAGMPRCEWIATHTDYDSAPDAHAIDRMASEAHAHAATCDVCKARGDYAAAHFGLLPSAPRWWRSDNWSIVAFPTWVIPAVAGLAVIAGVGALALLWRSVFPATS